MTIKISFQYRLSLNAGQFFCILQYFRPPLIYQGALAIRRIFSLVDIFTKPKFSNCPNVLKLVCFGSKICIESIKIGFKAIHHLQRRENLRLLLPPLILRL